MQLQTDIAGSVLTVSFPQFPESGDFDVDVSQTRPCASVTQTVASDSLTAWDGVVNVLSVCAAALDTQEVIDRLQIGVSTPPFFGGFYPTIIR